MVNLPASIEAYGMDDVANHVVPWQFARWFDVFSGHAKAFEGLIQHVEANAGIKRNYIHEQSDGDPVELFLVSMAWGYGNVGYGPSRVAKILTQPEAQVKLATIVGATRTHGAAAGWKALLRTDRIKGLGMAFGTKLLYFSGYSQAHRPPPLILDAFVRRALYRQLDPTAPAIDPKMPARSLVHLDDYLRYLELAEASSDRLGSPEVLEYALFDLGKRLRNGGGIQRDGIPCKLG